MVGPCGGWQYSPDPNDIVLTYTPHWTGSVASLQAGTMFGPFAGQVSDGTSRANSMARCMTPEEFSVQYSAKLDVAGTSLSVCFKIGLMLL